MPNSINAKPAPADHSILEPIAHRWSPVIFSPEPVEHAKLQQAFEAARWAPSAFNEQPWRFVYAQKGEQGRAVLEDLLNDGNSWAKNAGVLLIAFAKTTFSKNSKPNHNAEYDTGCSMGYLFLQLESLGLIGHQMSGFAIDSANEALQVPTDYKPMAMMAIGYPGDSTNADNALKEREAGERSRKPIEEFAFNGQWEQNT